MEEVSGTPGTNAGAPVIGNTPDPRFPLGRVERTLPSLDENLALDEALLLAAETDAAGETIRFWEWPTFAIVLGAGGSIAIDVNEDACRADGVPIHRRASGGGTVVLGPGCLVFSLVVAYARARELADVNASYRWILGRVVEAVRPFAPVSLVGTSDLAIGDLKVSGNSQQRKARHLLHHGTLLYGFDLPRIARYLNVPEREPAYRARRSHAEFVTNLPTTGPALADAIAAAFGAAPADLPEVNQDRVPELIRDRYQKPDWVRRR